MSDKLTHFDPQGASRMVDVGSKAATRRVAIASGRLRMHTSTQKLLAERRNAKGDALEVARVAGIMAAKRTSDLVPLCHPIMLTKVTIDYEFPAADSLLITCTAETTSQTGVEMEALTAVSVAALTVYDMGKAVDRGIEIGPIRLEEKQGGKSGHWRRRESSGDETTTEANAL